MVTEGRPDHANVLVWLCFILQNNSYHSKLVCAMFQISSIWQ